jgi:transposase
MAIRQGIREQMELLPPSIEQYVAEDAPVRVYDAFVEALDLAELGIHYEPMKEGNPCYDPRAMLKLLVYGYSYGVRSSRKLEREVYYNLSFIWLMGGLKPDHKTIAEFRRKNKEALKKALRQSVRLCLKLDMIDGNVLFIDGSKIRANASIKNTWTMEKCQKVLEKTDKKIEALIAEAEALDKEEEEMPPLVSVKEKLGDARAVKERVKAIMDELRGSGEPVINTVDKECVRTNSVHGTHAGYNVQIVVDDKHGLIVSCDVANTNNDLGHFSAQVDKAQEELGKKCRMAVADSGYADTDDLAKVDQQGIQVIVPTQMIASGREIGKFDKRNFRYDAEGDCYICPEGKTLRYSGLTRKRKGKIYQISDKGECLGCCNFGKCTTSRNGRKVMRLNAQDLRDRLEKEYILPQNQAIYKRRQEKAELPYGHIKRNLGVSSFLLRGREGARAEISLLSLCFNVRRMLSILGYKGIISKLKRVFSNKLTATSLPLSMIGNILQQSPSVLTLASYNTV